MIDTEIEMPNVQVIGKNFAQKSTENANLIFVVANGVAENPIDAAKNTIGDSENFKSARSILMHIGGGADISMIEAMQAMTIIQYKANPNAEILWSLNTADSLGKKI